jgi:hypothetical protein
MDEHLHSQVDKLFQDSLQFHGDDPSGEVWDRIENQLDKDDTLLEKTRTRRRLWITAGLLVFLACTGSLTLMHNKRDEPPVVKSIQRNDNGLAVFGKPRENNPETPIGSHILNPVEKKTGLRSSLYFQDPGKSDKNDSSAADLHLVSVQVPVSKILSFNFEKATIIAGQEIPDKMLVKQDRQSFKNRLSVTPFFSQEFAGYNLSDDDATAADGKEIEERERNVFSASVGVYINYKIKKRWVIQSGISYSWSRSIIDSATSYAVKDNSGNVQFKFNTISGYGFLQPSASVQPNVGDSVLTAKAYSQLHYLTVPLVLSYKIIMNRFSLQAGAGVSINFLTGATVETKIYGPNFRQDESAISMKGLKKVNYGILIKAELEYHFNSRLGIDMIPCFKNTLTPINIHSALSAYPYNFGIGLGMNYRL